MKTKLQLLILALGIAALSTPSAKANGQGNPNPGILPPQAVFKGKTMGEWNAAWWYWVLTTPGNVQMFDPTGEQAHVNNNGADGVFFLAKTWTGAPQTRTVTIPAGTPLYIPVMGLGILGDEAFWSILDDLLPPGSGIPADPTVQQGVDWAQSTIPTMTDLSVRIDGKLVASLEDGNLHYLNYLNDSLLSPLLNPDGSVLFPICYGYEISFILAPLAAGEHTIKMKGKGWGGFESDVTYHLTVEQGKK